MEEKGITNQFLARVGLSLNLSSATVPVMHPKWKKIKMMEINEKKKKHGVAVFDGKSISAPTTNYKRLGSRFT